MLGSNPSAEVCFKLWPHAINPPSNHQDASHVFHLSPNSEFHFPPNQNINKLTGLGTQL